ncbi:MAG: aldehyde:ferredoxin oxidoreductase [candidate division Zixibacteria bacterium]|nr:aldehyde:ferredoxin oxidoreductase [candidate division Zixibacteria bacterium]
MKILWNRLKKPGIDPLSPENPLMFMPGPLSGFPVPSSSRTCVVTKSPRTSPVESAYPHASTVTYSNMGGFFGPEIRFAGYDGIVISGKAPSPVYVVIDDDRIDIRDAKKFWGMGTDEFDKTFVDELGDRRFRTCYIGPAGENLVSYACMINTAARAAGRGGTGCVMGSKNLKAIAVRGTKMPTVADHKRFLDFLEEARNGFKGTESTMRWRYAGTAGALPWSSGRGSQAVKNFREGTFEEIDKIGYEAARQKAWVRDFACYCCPLSCKKSGAVKTAPYPGLVHDGPEYETGTMFGANLLVSDLGGLMKEIFAGDDHGLDIISTGNVIGFLMESYEKGNIDRAFLDGVDLTWGNVDAILRMLDKIAYREGVGDIASKGVRELARVIGKDCAKFAMHVKGHELAAWNVHVDPGMGISYATSNRGACHLNGRTVEAQNSTAMIDSTGVCLFAQEGFGENGLQNLLTAVTGVEWTKEEWAKAGERIFNLEKMFNLREGFRREDDRLPDRFFEEPLTMGPGKGAVLERDQFNKTLDEYYQTRSWDPKTTEPSKAKLRDLGLSFTI